MTDQQGDASGPPPAPHRISNDDGIVEMNEPSTDTSPEAIRVLKEHGVQAWRDYVEKAEQ